MSDRIELALSPEEWERWRSEATVRLVMGLAPGYSRTFNSLQLDEVSQIYADDAPLFIALLNDLLPDDDPRKLTQKRVSDMKDVAGLARDALAEYGPEELQGNVPRTLAAMIDRIEAFAFALESYLPPEG